MNENRCKRVMADGGIPVGHMVLEFGTRGMARMLDVIGLDFVVIDTEHSPFSSSQVADLIAWFNGTSVTPFVRIPQIEYHFIARTLDAGAQGIMVPNVKTGAQAKAIVDAAKYAPLGQRGVIMGNAHTGFESVVPAEFMQFSNQNSTIICQIESVEGLDNLEEIASTPGVDILWVGHFDLTQSMGIPGQFHDPRFLEGVKKVIDVAGRHGLGAGIQPGSVEQAREWMELGFNVISYNGDFSVYMRAMQEAIGAVRAIASV